MGLKYETAQYEASYGAISQLPSPETPEVAFVGRSNVGKSSLLNKLIGRKQLARVSSVPGKTANINFFDVDGVKFVDLPGYGFARVSRQEKQRWADLIGGYFEQERSFNLVISLVDIRHEAQKLDLQMISFLQEAELPFVVAFTKADKIARGKQNQAAAALRKAFHITPEQAIITSSETGLGIDELRRRIYLGASWIQSTSKSKSTSPTYTKNLLRFVRIWTQRSTPRKKMQLETFVR